MIPRLQSRRMLPQRPRLQYLIRPHAFSTTGCHREILDASALPDRLVPHYLETPSSTLLGLHWPSQPPRNILLVPKLHAPHVTASTVAFARHLHAEYPALSIIFEAAVARTVHQRLPFPIYAPGGGDSPAEAWDGQDLDLLPQKIDLVTTLGGDGTILRAASLFSQTPNVPPILSFSLGTLGFLGEWSFDEYKRAWREVYMSGRAMAMRDLQDPHTLIAAAVRSEAELGSEETRAKAQSQPEDAGCAWDGIRGKSMGLTRASKILLRHRLKVGVFDSHGNNINTLMVPTSTLSSKAVSPTTISTPPNQTPSIHAINELLIHRGPHPHLAVIDIFLNNHFLTEAVADGILISTPTGSTAYSLSAGGSIVHPLVESLLITPICARSLSFRPLILPWSTKVILRLSARNRGRELEMSIDGKRRAEIKVGMEIRIEGEDVGRIEDNSQGRFGGSRWKGGVPCVIRAPERGNADDRGDDDAGWVGGLNGLLKFNHPFGDLS